MRTSRTSRRRIIPIENRCSRLLAPVTQLWQSTGHPSGGEALADDVVRAKRFEVVDDEDNVQGVLGELDGGVIGLQLYDETGTTRLSIAVLNQKGGAPIVYFRDQNGTNRLQLQVDPNEVSTLVINDASGKLRAVIGTDQDGNSQLGYEAKDGSQRRL